MVKRMPHIETRLELSEDERFVIHRTIITDIKPVNYYRKALMLEQEL